MRPILTAILVSVVVVMPANSLAAAAKCKDFDTQPQAQKFFKGKGHGWKRLDGDKDGEACECLKGGSSYSNGRCAKWRKKYGKK